MKSKSFLRVLYLFLAVGFLVPPALIAGYGKVTSSEFVFMEEPHVMLLVGAGLVTLAAFLRMRFHK